ncbi:MAG: Nif3-like dinuclear metal center hexameric protein, partial [Planctomycetota bacterium]
MLVADLVLAMESIAPPSLAEPWDKVGLQIGRHEADLNDLVLLTIDLTDEVLKEAIERNAGAIVSYHPPIWKPLERITGADAKGRVLLDAVRAGIAVYTPHTALDATRGGVTDWLCAALAGSAFDPDQPVTGGDVRALRPIERQRTDQQTKIVTFVPESHIEQVRQALASAGAGIIGGYQVCSFAVTGAGTFFGGDETQPAVGETWRLETVAE